MKNTARKTDKIAKIHAALYKGEVFTASIKIGFWEVPHEGSQLHKVLFNALFLFTYMRIQTLLSRLFYFQARGAKITEVITVMLTKTKLTSRTWQRISSVSMSISPSLSPYKCQIINQNLQTISISLQ